MYPWLKYREIGLRIFKGVGKLRDLGLFNLLKKKQTETQNLIK